MRAVLTARAGQLFSPPLRRRGVCAYRCFGSPSSHRGGGESVHTAASDPRLLIADEGICAHRLLRNPCLLIGGGDKKTGPEGPVCLLRHVKNDVGLFLRLVLPHIRRRCRSGSRSSRGAAISFRRRCRRGRRLRFGRRRRRRFFTAAAHTEPTCQHKCQDNGALHVFSSKD
jgi:hypothetical protein